MINTDIKVLIVDDFRFMRRIIKTHLEEMGFDNIVEAGDGDTALEALKNDSFGLIISDWNMPKMTGYEFLKAVRSDEKTKTIPFIMITAEGQKAKAIDAMQAGVSDYIMKPFSTEVFEKKLNNVLASR